MYYFESDVREARYTPWILNQLKTHPVIQHFASDLATRQHRLVWRFSRRTACPLMVRIEMEPITRWRYIICPLEWWCHCNGVSQLDRSNGDARMWSLEPKRGAALPALNVSPKWIGKKATAWIVGCCRNESRMVPQDRNWSATME